MDTSDKIFSVISERKETTVPELQMTLSLPYKTVREGVELLVKKGRITYVGGMTFRVNEGAASAQARENAPVVMTARLRLLAMEAAKDPQLASMIDRFAQAPDVTFGISRFQVHLRIGYTQAHTVRDKCRNLGILSPDGQCLLTPRECLAVLGRTETVPFGRQPRTYTKGLLTPEEFVDRLRKEEAGATGAAARDDNIVEKMLKATDGGTKVRFKGPQEDPDDDFPFEFDEDVDLDAEDEDEEDEFDGDCFGERDEEDDEDEESEEASEESSAEELKAARQRLWERFERIRAQNNADEDDEEKDAETEEEDDDREEADDDGDFDEDLDDFSAIAEENALAAQDDEESEEESIYSERKRFLERERDRLRAMIARLEAEEEAERDEESSDDNDPKEVKTETRPDVIDPLEEEFVESLRLAAKKRREGFASHHGSEDDTSGGADGDGAPDPKKKKRKP